jgi:di/tricarboxylate transporter
VLSLLIPHPFPRALVMMSLVRAIIQKARVNRVDAASLGLSVFVSTTATSTILLTGDSTLNIATVGFSGVPLSWLGWAQYMAVPGFIASLLMLGLHLLVFKQTGPVLIAKDSTVTTKSSSGQISRSEIITLIWVCIALALWTTDFIHHIDPAWVALGVVVGLSLPKVGGILDAKDISTGINWPIIIFVAGALAIGAVGKSTGMSDWLANSLLPANPPGNPYAFAALVGGVTMLIHMVLGSALACMSIVAPPMVHYAASAGWNPLFPALVVYTAVSIHYLFPFQQVVILLGQGEAGGYSTRHVLRYGLPLTIVAFIVIVLVEVTWWQIVGLI